MTDRNWNRNSRRLLAWIAGALAISAQPALATDAMPEIADDQPIMQLSDENISGEFFPAEIVPAGVTSTEFRFGESEGRSSVCAPTYACPPPWWAHRTAGFGEFLLLRPGSTDLIYAVEQTDPDPNVASPTGPVGIANIDESAGFRVGFSVCASQCSSLVATYTSWEGDTSSTLTAQGANVLASPLFHPSVANSGASSLQSTGSQGISFDTVDLAYRHLWKGTATTAVNWLAGVRYGNMEQTSRTSQTIQVATGLTTLDTDIDFDGFGITGGLDFERYSCASGLSIYGNSMLSVLAGDWNATYTQTNQFGGGVIANRIEDFRVTPVVDAELGLAWTGCGGHVRVHTGLLVSAWYDAMVTRDYIDSVQRGSLVDISDTMTFSGLTTGLELRY